MRCLNRNKNKNFKLDELVKYVVTDNTEINGTNIGNWIDSFERNIRPYLKQLRGLYKGVDPVSKVQFDNVDIDNQVHVNLASMIVRNATNYFIGKPVTHAYSDNFKNAGLDKYLQEINKRSKEKTENKTLAKDCSIYGLGYELVNYDENKEMYYKRLDPLNTFLVVNDFVFEEKICFITYSKKIINGKTVKTGYVYTPEAIYSFNNQNNGFVIDSANEIKNVLGEFPVVMFKNNDELTGDFEFVIEPLRAYNKLFSCSFDDFESIANALLVFYNAVLSPEEKESLRKSRALSLISEDGTKEVKAEYIYKQLDTASFKELRTALKEDIVTISNVPDLNDKNFAGNASGVAISYKLIGFENLRADKQTYFEESLQERYELIGKNPSKPFEVEMDDITDTFYQNLPKNIEKDLQIANLYKDGVLSLETTHKEMELVDNVEDEAKKLKDEQKENIKTAKEALNTEVPTNIEKDKKNKNRLKV
jgi:SPP1 family phage portal protein